MSSPATSWALIQDADMAIDQGGETSGPTTHAEPTCLVDGKVVYREVAEAFNLEYAPVDSVL